MSRIRNWFVITSLGLSLTMPLAFLSGCEQEEPDMDEATEEMNEGMEEMREGMEETAEEAGDAVEEATD